MLIVALMVLLMVRWAVRLVLKLFILAVLAVLAASLYFGWLPFAEVAPGEAAASETSGPKEIDEP